MTNSWPSTTASGKTLVDPVAINVQGNVVVLAREQELAVDHLYYNVRIPGSEPSSTPPWAASQMGSTPEWSDEEWVGWNQLSLSATGGADSSSLLRVGGIDLITLAAAQPSAVGISAAADAPFQVVTDGQYITIFRLTNVGTLFMDRFVLVQSGTNSWTLQRAWEVRYQRSGQRDVSAGPRDTLSSTNMLSLPFLEPTTELAFGLGETVLSNQFTVVLAPTSGGGSRWHFFYFVSAGDSTVHHVSFPEDATGRVLMTGAPVDRISLQIAIPGQEPLPLQSAYGPGAVTYHEQEEAASADGQPAILRRVTRLMLAVPVRRPFGSASTLFAIVDYQLTPDGTITADQTLPVVLVDGDIANGPVFRPAAPSGGGYTVPALAVHDVGSGTVIAAALGTPHPASRPLLMDGGDGLVRIYYASASGGFEAVQYNPVMRRAIVPLTWSAGPNAFGELQLIGTSAGSSLNGTTATVADCASRSDLCNLTIYYGPTSNVGNEGWIGVPRELKAMTAVLNGLAADDPGAAAAQSLTMPFFDYSGRLQQAALPQGSVTTPTGYITLVTHRKDVQLTSVTVTPGGATTATLALTFTSEQGVPITQTWTNVPNVPATLVPLLRGTVSGGLYPAPASSDTVSYGLRTNSGGSIMLFGPSMSGPLTITVAAATNANPTLCNVTITAPGATPWSQENVNRDQDSFVAALRQNSVFSYVSPDATGGAIPNQVVAAMLTLQALSDLFDVVGTASTDPLHQAAVSASPFQGHFIWGTSAAIPNRMLALAAVPSDIPPYGQTATIINGSPATVPAGNGTWVATVDPSPASGQPDGRPLAASFDGSTAISVRVDTLQSLVLQPGRAWTMEAWCQPSQSSYILDCNFGSTAGLQPTPAYVMGTRCGSTVSLEAGTTIMFPALPAYDLRHGVTYEVFVSPSQLTSLKTNAVFALARGYKTTFQFCLGIFTSAAGESNVVLVINSGNPSSPTTLQGPVIPLNKWSHLAMTCHPGWPDWTYILYVNGEPTSFSTPAIYPPPAQPLVLGLGNFSSGLPNGEAGAVGGYAQLRVWNRVRTQAEIQSFMYADPSAQVHFPRELVGWWPLDGTTSFPSVVPSAPTGVSGGGHTDTIGGPLGYLFGGVAGSPCMTAVPARDTGRQIRNGRWNHVAAVYRATGALNMNAVPPTPTALDYAWCSRSESLGLSAGGSLEAWIAPLSQSSLQIIMSQWGSTADDQAYWWGINSLGQLGFTVNYTLEDGTSGPVNLLSPQSVCDGLPHHVVATWAILQTTADSGITTTTATASIYIDGVAAASSTPVTGTTITTASSTAAFCIGLGALGPTPDVQDDPTQNWYYTGQITGARVWSQALTADQVAEARQLGRAFDSEPGVLAAWWFDEGTGPAAGDSVGENNLTLSDSTMWTDVNWFPTTTLYIDGQLVDAIAGTDSGYPSPVPQFTIGGCAIAGGARSGAFDGGLAEIRVWNVARSADQLRDGMYRSVPPGDPSLVAYWPLNGNFNDATGLGNNGEGSHLPSFSDSGAPIAADGPEVLNPWTGPVTTFQQSLASTPAVVEYGDVNQDGDGLLQGILRRAYVWVPPSHSGLPLMDTSYGAGNLAMVYLGQVQTNPTLTGFIEGAPPVPSENLSRPLYDSSYGYNAYADASTVSLVQPSTTSFNFSSQSSMANTSSVEVGAGLVSEVDLKVLGITLFKGDFKIGYKHKRSQQSGTQAGYTAMSSWTRTVTETMGLRGAWEQREALTKDYLNPSIGRRYQPSNVGYALVESLTADLYSLQMRGSGVMVGLSVVPDPEIPPDKNIMIFPINPLYVKNGTLDGKVGLVNDPDYPDADSNRGSYFKPVEAYALKQRIGQDVQRARAYYDQLSAETLGTSREELQSGPASEDDFDAGSSGPPFSSPSASGLVNTYVWSAYGGLHAEQEQFTSQHSRVFTGLSSANTMDGIAMDGKAVARMFGLLMGAYHSVDFLAGTSATLQVSKGETDTTGFGLNVSVAGEPVLQAYVQGAGDPTDPTKDPYSNGPAPGKVDSYRFMAFYLPSDGDNGTAFRDDVIDPNWLQHSSDPNAIALRGVNFDHCEPWRILYRVTYVSRVPPQFNTNPSQSVGAAPVQIIATEDNLLLVDLVQQNLGGSPPTRENVGAALQTVLTSTDVHAATLCGVIPWWAGFLSAAADRSSAQAASLAQIQLNTYSYLMSGYGSGLLPIRAASSSGTPRGGRRRARAPLHRATATPRVRQA